MLHPGECPNHVQSQPGLFLRRSVPVYRLVPVLTVYVTEQPFTWQLPLYLDWELNEAVKRRTIGQQRLQRTIHSVQLQSPSKSAITFYNPCLLCFENPMQLVHYQVANLLPPALAEEVILSVASRCVCVCECVCLRSAG